MSRITRYFIIPSRILTRVYLKTNRVIQVNRIFIIKSIFAFLFLLTSCDISATSDYDRLCSIYSGIVMQSVVDGQKEYLLAEEIENQLPEFFNKNYVHIVKAARVKRYPFIKQLAEAETKKNWECALIRDYYMGKYDDSDKN